MTYIIQAFISKNQNSIFPIADSVFVPLEQDFFLLPITKLFREQFGIRNLQLLEGNSLEFDAIHNLGCKLSETINSVYIEAEFFGGDGMQVSLYFENGRLMAGPIISGDAINVALRYLGVVKGASSDEFDTLNLGKYRSTKKWLSH